MGKKTGFLEFDRKDGGYRSVEKRIKDYKDVSKYLSHEVVQVQASRCMDCGVPFCHAMGCPVNNLIPEWNDLIYKGKWEESYRRLEETNTLPEITGRICPAPCETSCTLSINDRPVTIKQIELAIIEYAFEKGWVKPVQPKIELNKKIAIIGSGPAGLSAAYRLRKPGYQITVFEKSTEIGGLLRYGIPDFKLEKTVLDRRIKIMKESGIKFETSVNIGEDISYRYLDKTFNIILLTSGAGQPRDIDVPGRNLSGIYFAMDYLTLSNKYIAGEIKMRDLISAEEKNVLVVGGGNTGSDCVGTANRQGAKKVFQFEIMPKPDEWNNTWNPVWPDWPVILRTTSSHKEGVERDWSILIKKFSGSNKKVKEVHCSKLEWESGKNNSAPQMTEIKGSEFNIKADLVLIAAGFVHTEHNKLLNDMHIEYDKIDNIKTDNNYKTSVKNVFAAGDSDTGASLIVKAINHGQKAAKAIHEHLSY